MARLPYISPYIDAREEACPFKDFYRVMSQRRQVVTRSRAFSSDNIEEIHARHREERKGAFGEIAEWNPALHHGSKPSKVFNKAYYYTPEPVRSSVKPPTSCEDWKSFFLIRVPIIQWLWSYKAKHLIGDLVAGITIGMTHIPQGTSCNFMR